MVYKVSVWVSCNYSARSSPIRWLKATCSHSATFQGGQEPDIRGVLHLSWFCLYVSSSGCLCLFQTLSSFPSEGCMWPHLGSHLDHLRQTPSHKILAFVTPFAMRSNTQLFQRMYLAILQLGSQSDSLTDLLWPMWELREQLEKKGLNCLTLFQTSSEQFTSIPVLIENNYICMVVYGLKSYYAFNQLISFS